jgi:hypothetical protein
MGFTCTLERGSTVWILFHSRAHREHPRTPKAFKSRSAPLESEMLRPFGEIIRHHEARLTGYDHLCNRALELHSPGKVCDTSWGR